MDHSFSEPFNAQLQDTKKENEAISPAAKGPSSRRTNSFSSLSSLSSCSSANFQSSYLSDDSPRSPATPLQSSGVPFSWEKLPGIPKKQTQRKKKDSNDLSLPLPPPTTSKRFIYNEPTSKSKNTYIDRSFRKDPFFAAFVECGRDDEGNTGLSSIWKGNNKVPRNLSDRLGFISFYSSCKSSFAISESIVYLPRSSKVSYGLSPRPSK